MFIEDKSKVSVKNLDLARAVESLREELEAVSWYQQRADACSDGQLKKIFIHNANEEKEHAAMVLEWIRRKDTCFDKELRDYLFTDKPIIDLEKGHHD